jgi:hypothetical protein
MSLQERLMMEAERLHREAALLSNQLHTFDDTDVTGVKPVIEKILAKRNEWKQVRARLDHIKKFGGPASPETTESPGETPEAAVLDGSVAELKVTLQQVSVNLCKYEKKLRDQPEHSRVPLWEQELAKLKAIKHDLQAKLIQKKYA